MAVINQRSILHDKFARWMHRDDFSGDDINLMIQMAIQRLGNDLRAALNEQRVVIDGSTTVDGAYPVPGDYIEALSVEVADSSSNLTSISYLGITAFNRLSASGSVGCGYHISSDTETIDAPVTDQGEPTSTHLRTQQTSDLMLYLRPVTGQDVTLTYIGMPKYLESNTGLNSKNPIMIELATVMLKSLLLEGHIFVQDWEQYDRVYTEYQRLVAAANRRYSQARMAPGSAVVYPRRNLQSARPVRSM